MAETYLVRYAHRTTNQLQNIFDYIKQDSPQNAAKMIARLVDAIEGLESLPQRYALVRNTEAMGEDIRSMVVRSYLVRYQINEGARTVTILSVRHGARRPGL